MKKRYAMKFSMRLYKRENGYYYYEFERNRPVSLKTKDKEKAERKFNDKKRKFLKARIEELDKVKRTTLTDFKEIFFRDHTDIAEDTIRAYDLAMRLFIDSVGGSTIMSRIDTKHIDKFKSDCRARDCRKTTINTYLRHLKGVFNKAFEWEIIIKKVPIKLYRIPKRHPRILSTKERKAILKYAKKKNYEMYRIILFCLWTGVRLAEMAGLTWQNVHGDTARIIGKGDKERTIILLPKALEAMGSPKDIGRVFVHWNNLGRYSKEFKKIAKAVGIKDIHFHHLRHTAATQMVESGIELSFVQEMLGHSDISTTQIYVKIVQATLKEKMQKMRY